MKKPESAQAAKRPGRLRRHNRLRRLHRWFGLISLVFILVLSVTGLGLNHSAQWGLDDRYLEAPWLFAWYGFEAPEPTASFAADDARVTLVGNRVYLDAAEAARGIDALVGAVAWSEFYVAATPGSLLFLSGRAELVDRVDLGPSLRAPIESIAGTGERLLVLSGGSSFAFDARTSALTPHEGGSAVVDWPSASTVPEPLADTLARSYRGPGVSVERLLFDLHNGRLFARAGVWLLDAAGILLVGLSVTGLVLWIKRRS